MDSDLSFISKANSIVQKYLENNANNCISGSSSIKAIYEEDANTEDEEVKDSAEILINYLNESLWDKLHS